MDWKLEILARSGASAVVECARIEDPDGNAG
jgi:hypothetical protein